MKLHTALKEFDHFEYQGIRHLVLYNARVTGNKVLYTIGPIMDSEQVKVAQAWIDSTDPKDVCLFGSCAFITLTPEELSLYTLIHGQVPSKGMYSADDVQLLWSSLRHMIRSDVPVTTKHDMLTRFSSRTVDGLPVNKLLSLLKPFDYSEVEWLY